MAEYIEREAALNEINKAHGLYEASLRVSDIKTANVAKMRHGKWIMPLLMADGHIHGECSHCHKIRIIDDYCSACGTIMDLEDMED